MKAGIGLGAILLVIVEIIIIGAGFLELRKNQTVDSNIISQDASVAQYDNLYDSPQQFMFGIYNANKNVSPPADYRIRAVIVPHHITATTAIASGIRMLQNQSFSNIILVSPDHFNHCAKIFCTINARYSTLFGDVRSSPDTVKSLLASSLAGEDAGLFENEHGIYSVLPYIANYFPRVTVTPIALSQYLSWDTFHKEEFLRLLRDVINEDTILMISSDFSHYLSYDEAEQMDEETARVIFSKDLEGIVQLKNPEQSDCPNCLWLLAALADERGFYNPSVVLHTNSATILEEPDVSRTTSHFSMVWYEDSQLDSSDFAVGGDVTLTRSNKAPKVSESVMNWWVGKGTRALNLEGPLATNCKISGNPYIFCNLDTKWKMIKDLATHWVVMNNHMWDRGGIGFEETMRLLKEGGKVAITDELIEDDLVRYIAFSAVMNPVAQNYSGIASNSEDRVIQELKNNPSDKLTIVFVHAGKEYSALSSGYEEKLYERLVDVGADAVVVGHAHVAGDVYLYKNKPIFRGVGNFMFDQYDKKATSTVKMIRLRKSDERVLFQTMITPMF